MTSAVNSGRKATKQTKKKKQMGLSVQADMYAGHPDSSVGSLSGFCLANTTSCAGSHPASDASKNIDK